MKSLCLLFAGLALLSFASAAELHCRVGEAKCATWSYKGRINSNVVCCPGLAGQGFFMNMGLAPPDNCKCSKGTAEAYPDDSSGAASGIHPRRHALAVLLPLLVGLLAALRPL